MIDDTTFRGINGDVLRFLDIWKQQQQYTEPTLTFAHLWELYKAFYPTSDLYDADMRPYQRESEHLSISCETDLFSDMWIDVISAVKRRLYLEKLTDDLNF